MEEYKVIEEELKLQIPDYFISKNSRSGEATIQPAKNKYPEELADIKMKKINDYYELVHQVKQCHSIENEP